MGGAPPVCRPAFPAIWVLCQFIRSPPAGKGVGWGRDRDRESGADFHLGGGQFPERDDQIMSIVASDLSFGRRVGFCACWGFFAGRFALCLWPRDGSGAPALPMDKDCTLKLIRDFVQFRYTGDWFIGQHLLACGGRISAWH